MTLPVPWWVYGEITDPDSNVVSGATVYASGNSSASSGSTTSNVSGNYGINLQDYSSDGDTVRVTAISGSYSKDATFSLDVSDLFKEQNLQFEEAGEEVFGGIIIIESESPIKINYIEGKKVYINV